MLRVLLDRLDELQPSVDFLLILRSGDVSVSRNSRERADGASHQVEIVKVDDDLVYLPVGKLLQHVLVLVLGLPPPFLFLPAPLLGLVVLVHKVILVAKVVLVDINIS